MAKARKPLFETLLMRMFTESDFLKEFAQGGAARAQALESIGFDPQDVRRILLELDKIDFEQIKQAILTMGCSKALEEVLLEPHN
ncbi:MAG: hypothetical protein JO071_13300 [Deltaproteobacteria bacterium]|nr:hypothetical protein [Deltaproteobacteria bacterium]